MKVLTALSNTVLNGDESATFTRKQIEDALKLGDHSVHRQKLFSGDPVEKSKSGTDAVIDELREKFTSGPGYS